jgi:hypothetical protein
MAGLYYIQSTGFVGDSLLWWRPDGKGYTTNLDQAWKVTREKAEEICKTRPEEDFMWPSDVVDSLASRHCAVSLGTLRTMANRYGEFPDKRARLLEVLNAAWAKFPELRFGQLMFMFAKGDESRLFNIEDSELEVEVRKALE